MSCPTRRNSNLYSILDKNTKCPHVWLIFVGMLKKMKHKMWNISIWCNGAAIKLMESWVWTFHSISGSYGYNERLEQGDAEFIRHVDLHCTKRGLLLPLNPLEEKLKVKIRAKISHWLPIINTVTPGSHSPAFLTASIYPAVLKCIISELGFMRANPLSVSPSWTPAATITGSVREDPQQHSSVAPSW